jgi:hypothetical protein
MINTALFISPSGISDPCGTVAGMVTPKGSMSTEGESLQVCPTIRMHDMCSLGDAADVNPLMKGPEIPDGLMNNTVCFITNINSYYVVFST